MSDIVKNVKLRLDKKYDIDDITEENFWKRKEPKYVILSINIKNNTMNYTKSRFGLYHIRKVNYIRRCMIWKIQVKKILDTIRPLNVDLIQHLLFKFIGCPNPYFDITYQRERYGAAYMEDISRELCDANYKYLIF